jgi:hypothetical protein
MAITPVQNNKNEPSYVKSMAIGALAGYSLKYLLPLTSQEKDDTFKSKLGEIKTKTGKNTLKEIEAERSLIAITKSLRPTEVFVFLGIIVAMVFACIANINRGLSQEKQ